MSSILELERDFVAFEIPPFRLVFWTLMAVIILVAIALRGF